MQYFKEVHTYLYINALIPIFHLYPINSINLHSFLITLCLENINKYCVDTFSQQLYQTIQPYVSSLCKNASLEEAILFAAVAVGGSVEPRSLMI